MVTNWKRLNPPSKTKHPEIVTKVRNMADQLGGKLFISRRGVPIANVKIGEMRYSATWFRKHKFWRVFWPFLMWDYGEQNKLDFKTDQELVGHFEQLRKEG